MREILFRGQLRRKGEKVNMAGEPLPSIWKYGGVSQIKPGGAVIYQTEPEIKKHPVYGDTVGQYTGLKDRNGVKIFDGDIIKSTETEDFAVVQWFEEHSAFMACIPSLHDVGYIGEVEPETIEVIGNVYDNPELLGGGTDA